MYSCPSLKMYDIHICRTRGTIEVNSATKASRRGDSHELQRLFRHNDMIRSFSRASERCKVRDSGVMQSLSILPDPSGPIA